jgi:hypothetical protein
VITKCEGPFAIGFLVIPLPLNIVTVKHQFLEHIWRLTMLANAVNPHLLIAVSSSGYDAILED